MSIKELNKSEKIQLLVVVVLVFTLTITQVTTLATAATTTTIGQDVPVKSASSPYPESSMVYLGSFTERKVVPAIIIYDPPGRQSYQQVTEGNTISFSVDIEANMAGVTGGGSFSSWVTVRTSYKSSDSTSEDDMGPGKGDRIVCRTFDFTYDVYEVFEGPGPLYATSTSATVYSYQHYTYVSLRSVTLIGTELLSRSDIENIYNVVVENRTNTPGDYEEFVRVSANSTMIITVEMRVDAGYSFGVDAESETGIPAVPKIKFRYIITISASYSYIVEVYFHDDQNMIETYMCADVPFTEGFFSDLLVPGWTFWFRTP